MPKLKSIYNLKGTFTNLLEDTGKNSFLIPTYQRGYKWSSLEGKGQVDILMHDLFNAFKSKSPRYYLQFLTLKSNETELEVIDGQQRLTTLSILFSVIFYLLPEEEPTNFVTSKLKYQARLNFIEKYIYNDIKTLLEYDDWISFRDSNPDHDNQDVYFIFHAVQAINKSLSSELAKLPQFLDYICNQVFLIVNLLDENLNSEKVFVNVNKGVKLNDEDLVKGLLITKLPLDILNQKIRATEIEINELRTNLGRQWDDLSSWAYREDIRSFFQSVNDNARIDWLIRLTFPNIEDNGSGHPMFSHFDKLYTQEKVSAEDIFNAIRRTKMMLNDWFNEPETCNLLGFILNAKGCPQKEFLWRELSAKQTKADIVTYLKAWCLKLLPLDKDLALSELNYEDHKGELFNVFLIVDVMKFLPINGRHAVQYDFSKISSGQWSLEHIFPQNAKDFKAINELSLDDIEIIKPLIPIDVDDLISDSEGKVFELYTKIINAKKGFLISSEERNALVDLLKYNAPDLHSIGNLALLLINMNSSLSNHFFKKKREILVRKISEGKFVPFHTYDVFSKLIINNDNDYSVWSKQNIAGHGQYINDQIVTLVSYLNK